MVIYPLVAMPLFSKAKWCALDVLSAPHLLAAGCAAAWLALLQAEHAVIPEHLTGLFIPLPFWLSNSVLNVPFWLLRAFSVLCTSALSQDGSTINSSCDLCVAIDRNDWQLLLRSASRSLKMRSMEARRGARVRRVGQGCRWTLRTWCRKRLRG